jgi:hypothetical protein
MDKIALCFIINYEHVLYKEALWREWIEANKNIINVYVFYKDINKIKSRWLQQYAIPPKYICNTSYYHVVPAYISILKFALNHDKNNKWFCYLTDSCCPIVSPSKFRFIFKKYQNHTIMAHSRAHWNIHFHRRANLEKLPAKLHMANDPWFVLTRDNAMDVINFMVNEYNMCNLICNGGLANESLFAIILTHYNKINNVINKTTHMADWFRMSSPTSPHLFKEGTEEEIQFIEDFLEKNDFTMFIRKVHPKFPDEILKIYIYNNNDNDIYKNDDISTIKKYASDYINKYFITGLFIGLFYIYSFFYFFIFQ